VKTEILPANIESIAVAVQILARGGLVAFPTDTVYGVGAHGFSPEAIERLYIAKERPEEKAIPLLIAKREDLSLVSKEVPEMAWRLIERFWPGGLTLVLPKAPGLPDILCAGGDSVAVRMPDHPIALALIEAVGVPLATTSANISGHPSPVMAEEVQRELEGRIELILDGGRCPGGISSTVLDLTMEPPTILRLGPVSKEEIEVLLSGEQ